MSETVCIRCGKVRILLHKWEEKAARGPVLIREETVCPDRECQKLVDKKFEDLRARKEALRH